MTTTTAPHRSELGAARARLEVLRARPEPAPCEVCEARRRARPPYMAAGCVYVVIGLVFAAVLLTGLALLWSIASIELQLQ